MRYREKFVYPTRRLLLPIVLFVAGISIGGCGSNTSMGGSNNGTSNSYISAEEASGHVGQYETVRFNVGYTFTDSSGTEFLDQYQDYKSGFVVTIFTSNLSNYSVDPASTYLGSTVDVTGTISSYGGYVEILNPDKISLVE
jgi:hypothetical protein